LKNYFVEVKQSYHPNHTYNYYRAIDHLVYTCHSLSDKGYIIVVDHACCLILKKNKVIFVGNKKKNVYKIKTDACIKIKSCFVASINDSFL